MLDIILIILIILLAYTYFYRNYEMFDNFDKLNNFYDKNNYLKSVNKTVDYNMGAIPMYDLKNFNALAWHLRFKEMVGERYDYNDKYDKTSWDNYIKDSDKNDWDCGNDDKNCHGSNCD